MILRFAVSILLASSLLFAGCATSPTIWKASDVGKRTETHIRLTHQGETVTTVETSTIRKLVEIKERIERHAGVGSVELLIAGGDQPNAFAGTHPQLGRVVAINTAMLQLLGTDWDGYAAIIGHEYAHLALNHGAVRQEREALRQGVATAVGIALGVVGVPMGGTIADVGTSVVTTVYSREEEREADRKGFDYMVQAGFDPSGAVRVWQRMLDAGHGSTSIPFLSTHPMSSERVDNMKALMGPRQISVTPVAVPEVQQYFKPEGRPSAPRVPNDFLAFEKKVALERRHNAVAVAKDNTNWVWGGAWGTSSEQRAIEMALDYCQKEASQRGISTPCEVYAVNGSPHVSSNVAPKTSLTGQPEVAQKSIRDFEREFDVARQANDDRPENNAIAIAKSPSRWVWGTSSSAATQRQAIQQAVENCKKEALKAEIFELCKLYSLNGQVTWDFMR
jgi:Zn-dependent protease with chaperone function